MNDLISNPVMMGLLGGAVGLLVKGLWGRVFGSPTEGSIPTLIAAINVQLVEINLKLALMLADKERMKEDHKEAVKDFWDHMDKFHSKPGGDSGMHRAVRSRGE